MKAKQLAIAISGLITVLSISTSFAAISPTCGWYLEGNVGYPKQQNRSYGNLHTKENHVGLNANIGYKFMPFFATEVGYSYYYSIRLQNSVDTVARDKLSAADVALRGILPFWSPGLELFGKLGVDQLYSHIQTVHSRSLKGTGVRRGHHSAVGLYIGAGIQYYFYPEFAFVVQWQRANGEHNKTGNVDLYSVGLAFIVD